MLRRLVPLLLVLPLAGCGLWGPEGGPGGPDGAAPSASVVPEDAVLGSDGVQRVTLTADDRLRFTPSAVRATVGTIEFTVKNTGGTPHSLVVEGKRVDNVNGGASRTLTVTITKPGTYPFPCAYHASSGMKGTLVVRAA